MREEGCGGEAPGDEVAGCHSEAVAAPALARGRASPHTPCSYSHPVSAAKPAAKPSASAEPW